MRCPPPTILLQVPPTATAASSSGASSASRTNQDELYESKNEQHEIIQQILQSSVDNVIDQVKAEKARLEQLRQLQLQQEAEAAAAQQDKGKGRAESYDGDASTSVNSDTIPVIRISSDKDGSSPAVSTANMKDPGSSRRSRFGIRRMFNHIVDKPSNTTKHGTITMTSPEGSQASKLHEALPTSVEPSPAASQSPEATLDVQQKAHHSSPLHRFIERHRRSASDSCESSTNSSETMQVLIFTYLPLTLSRLSLTFPKTNTPKRECVACLSDFPRKSLILTTCHPYCLSCFASLITAAISNEAQWPPKCCLNPIPSRTITKTLSKTKSKSHASLLRLYREKSIEYAIPPADRIYCPHPSGCSLLVQSYDKASKTARCSKNHTFCVLCRQCPPHKGSEPCPEDKDSQLLAEIAAEYGWRRCLRCSMLVEHREACAHMTCRCGAQFCYVCGKVWRTCSCNHGELVQIKERAERKRLERLEREAAAGNGGAGSSRDAEREMVRERESVTDAAWLENALRLIEEFEEGERARLEEERREEARRREERRRCEAEERRRREEERIKELEERYGKLRCELLEVRNWQRGELIRAQTREMDECRLNALRERDQIVDDLERERSRLRAETKAKIEEREMKWKKEYTVRVAWEKQLEEEYAQQLTDFWEGRIGGIEQAEMALHAYMMKNDARRDAWRKTRNAELERFRYTVQEDLDIAEEFMDALIEKARKMAEDKQREVKKKHRAEFRWFELAVTERVRLMAEMETVERENGGDVSDAGSVSLTDDDFSRSGDDESGGSFPDVYL
ncbi:hypothetical protein V8F20_001652 [Naviculisporaceae sp. PSN 640]